MCVCVCVWDVCHDGEPASPTTRAQVRPRTLADVLESVVQIGAAAGSPAAATKLLSQLRARLRRVVAMVAAPASVYRPKVLSLEGLSPLLAAGHWLPEMKMLAGARDELQEPGAAATRLRWEQVRGPLSPPTTFPPLGDTRAPSCGARTVGAHSCGGWDDSCASRSGGWMAGAAEVAPACCSGEEERKWSCQCFPTEQLVGRPCSDTPSWVIACSATPPRWNPRLGAHATVLSFHPDCGERLLPLLPQVLSYAPDVLLLPLANAQAEGALSEVAALASQPGWWALPAVQRAQVYIVDSSLFSVPGPRVVEGVELLARILHPDHVDLKAPPGAILKLNLTRGQRCRPRQLRNFFQPFS